MPGTPAWHTARRGDWKVFGKSLGPYFLCITIVLWICLPIFWGSTYLLEYYFYRLNIFVVDFDSQAVGSANALAGPPIVQALTEINSQNHPHLTYQTVPPEHFPGGVADVMEAVGHNEAWGAVVIMPNATTAWRNAIENGNSSYDASGSVGVYFSGAHFYQIILIYVVPYMKRNVQTGLRQASDMAVRGFLQTATAARNATAITTAARAPQALGIGFGMFQYDVRPITEWASAAPMEAGLIYNVIFTFHLTLLSAIARLSSGLQVKLKTTTLIRLRLAIPAFCYFWFSLWYALVVRAYQVPLDASVGRAGFVVFWMLNYITYLAIGLALEALMSLVTIRWFPFALICWIILNITSSFLPLQLMQPFYWWGFAWPFRLNVEASKLIFYNTQPRHHLGRYFGGLLAWAFAGVISVTLFQLLDRWRMDRGMRKAMAAKKQQQADNVENGEKHNNEEDGSHDSSDDHHHHHGGRHAGEAAAAGGAAAAASSASPTSSRQEGQQGEERNASDASSGNRSSEAQHTQGATQQEQQQQEPQEYMTQSHKGESTGPVFLGGQSRQTSELSGRSTYYDAPTPGAAY